MENFKELADGLVEKFNARIEQETKGLLTSEEVVKLKSDWEASVTNMTEKQLSDFNGVIEGLKKEVQDVNKTSEAVKEIVKNQAEEIKELKGKEVSLTTKMNRTEAFERLITDGLKSQEFADFQNKGFKGATSKMQIGKDVRNTGKVDLLSAEKAVTPISSHTGTVMISEVSDIVRDDAPNRKSHVRDLMNVGMTDQAQIVAGQVYNFTDALTLGAVMLAENATAPESVFASKENTWTVKRIANSMRISKRWLKTNGLQWVIDTVLAKLVDATLTKEDEQLLIGDGLGDNVKGLLNDAQEFDLTPNTYAALDFDTVATYNSGTQSLVTFVAAHGMRNGDSLTIANATHAGYNATHTAVEVVNGLQVIIDVAYVAEAAGLVDAWTGSSASIFYLGVDLANNYDVLEVSKALLQADNFDVTGNIINPQDLTKMSLLKATTGEYLGLGSASLSGLPIIQTTAIPTGRYATGDFSRTGLELKEYSPLSIQFVEDTTTQANNEIMVFIEEEIIFPIYNPYAFIKGKFSSAKAQLETA